MNHPDILYLPESGPQIARSSRFLGENITEYIRRDVASISLLADILIGSVDGVDPNFIIGGADDPYIRRWWLRREYDHGSIYLHQIMRDDDDRALHDHPWDSTSIILRGELREILPDGERVLIPGSITSRKAADAHRLELVDREVWSLFITGPRIRDWGFHCPNGWVHWRDFTNSEDGGATIGRGCGE